MKTTQVEKVAAKLRRTMAPNRWIKPWNESDFQRDWIRLAKHVLRKGYKP